MLVKVKIEKIEKTFIPLELFAFNDIIKSLMLKRQKSQLMLSYTKTIANFVNDCRLEAMKAKHLIKSDLVSRFDEHILWLAELDTINSERIQLKKDMDELLAKQLRQNIDIKVDSQLLAELEAFASLFARHLDSAEGLAEEFNSKYEPLEIFLNFLDLRAVLANLELALDDGEHLGIMHSILVRKASMEVLVRGLTKQLAEELKRQQEFISMASTANDELQKILSDVKFRNQ